MTQHRNFWCFSAARGHVNQDSQPWIFNQKHTPVPTHWHTFCGNCCDCSYLRSFHSSFSCHHATQSFTLTVLHRTRQTTAQKHPLNGHLRVVPRLKSRKSFIKCTEPTNTTAKAARYGENDSSPWTPKCILTVLTNTSHLAQRTPGQPGRHSTGCVHSLACQRKVRVFQRIRHLWKWHQADHATPTGLPNDGLCLLSPRPDNG